MEHCHLSISSLALNFGLVRPFFLNQPLIPNLVQEENASKIAPNPLTIEATTMLLAFETRSLTAPENENGKPRAHSQLIPRNANIYP